MAGLPPQLRPLSCVPWSKIWGLRCVVNSLVYPVSFLVLVLCRSEKERCAPCLLLGGHFPVPGCFGRE